MNKCTDSDIQEMLPDLLHRALADGERLRVEAHLATCESCQEDLDVLRTVKSAAVFAPSIDVDRVVRQIPPYRTIIPATERPARTRVVSWLVAASLAVVVLGGGSVLLQSNGSPTSNSPGYQKLPSAVAKAPETTQPSRAESLVLARQPAQPKCHAGSARACSRRRRRRPERWRSRAADERHGRLRCAPGFRAGSGDLRGQR